MSGTDAPLTVSLHFSHPTIEYPRDVIGRVFVGLGQRDEDETFAWGCGIAGGCDIRTIRASAAQRGALRAATPADPERTAAADQCGYPHRSAGAGGLRRVFHLQFFRDRRP